MAHQYLSVADYLAAERKEDAPRHEYFNGTLRPCAAASPDHNGITRQLLALLGAALDTATYRVSAAHILVQLSATCFVRPDVTVSRIPDMPTPDDVMTAPLVVIEVFTHATVAFDLGQKAHAYRACPSIAEYVLVDCERAFVHVQRRRPDGTHWEMRDYRGDEAVELRSLGVTLALDAMYGDG